MALGIAVLAGLVLAALRILHLIYAHLSSPTRCIPGPFLARYTRLWYFWRVYLGNFGEDSIRLHQKYGPVVRVAPDMFSINKLHSMATTMPKSDWYLAWRHPDHRHPTLFGETDARLSMHIRKAISSVYSLSSILSYEKYVEETSAIFQQRLRETADSGEAIDMSHWFQCFAFDVIGNITFSRPFGFLDEGKDIFGLLKAIGSLLAYSSLVGIYIALHPILFTSLGWFGLGGAEGRMVLLKRAEAIIEEKSSQRRDKKGVSDLNPDAPQDFIDKALAQHEQDPDAMTSEDMLQLAIANITAGSDTTAIGLSSVLNHLIRDPSAMAKLRQEVDACLADGGSLTYKETLEMPYLRAVIKEGLRLHCPIGLPLWRTVTDSGLLIDGVHFPPGNTIGVNPWAAHYNRDVFGPDVAEFRPERWIEAEKEGGERFKRMNASFVPFGHGNRNCMGRHVSILEFNKLVPLLVSNFDFELKHPERRWTSVNFWFVRPTDFYVRVKLRSH